MLNTGLKKSVICWRVFWYALALVVIGTISVMSSARGLDFYSRVARVHLTAVLAGFLIFFAAWKFNYQIYRSQWKILYAVILAALSGVLVFGSVERGSLSWFNLGPFSVQPAELCRIAFILCVAAFLDINSKRMHLARSTAGALALALPVFALIMKQPDFSSIIITFPVIIAMLFCAGANIFHLAVICGLGLSCAVFPVLWLLISLKEAQSANFAIKLFYGLSRLSWGSLYFAGAVCLCAYVAYILFKKFQRKIPRAYFAIAALVIITGYAGGAWVYGQMKNYQRKRFETFLSPKNDPRGAGYNVLQAQIAMGAGGFAGRGVFSGTQSRLGFIPERHTDFIVSVVGEEMGFLGAFAVLGLYVLLLRRIVLIAQTARDDFGYFALCGIFAMFSVYLVVNFGMMVGIMPVAGVPLPFVSYGGSNLVSSLWALGIAESVYARRVAFV